MYSFLLGFKSSLLTSNYFFHGKNDKEQEKKEIKSYGAFKRDLFKRRNVNLYVCLFIRQ